MMRSVAIAVTLALMVTGQHLDQSTEETGSFRNMPQGKMWQSWTAGWSANLGHIDVLLGSRFPCEAMSGVLTVKSGQPSSMDDATSTDNVLLTQSITTQCAAAASTACDNNDCTQWHRFTLSSPVALTQGQQYTFVLSGMTSADLTRTARVGVSLSNSNPGGDCSLVRTTKFATKYGHYTFRTQMQSPDAVSAPVGQDDSSERSTDGGSSAVAVAGIVVPVVVLMIFVIILVILVKNRNNRRTDVSSLGSNSNADSHSIALTDLDSLSDIRSISSVAPSVRSYGAGRHRILVKSADQQSAADDSSGMWAYRPGGFATMEEGEDELSFQTTQFYSTDDTGSIASRSYPRYDIQDDGQTQEIAV